MFRFRLNERLGRLGRLTAIAAVMGAMGASAASAQIHFRGGGFVANFSGCEEYGWFNNQSHMIRARYRPAELEGNNNEASLSLFLHTGTENYRRQGPLDFTFQSFQSNFIWTGSGRTTPRPRIRVFSQSPEVITEETPEVQMRMRIRNFGTLAGCQVDVGIVMTRFPRLN